MMHSEEIHLQGTFGSHNQKYRAVIMAKYLPSSDTACQEEDGFIRLASLVQVDAQDFQGQHIGHPDI